MKFIHIFLVLTLAFSSCDSNNREANREDKVSADYAPAPAAIEEKSEADVSNSNEIISVDDDLNSGLTKTYAVAKDAAIATSSTTNQNQNTGKPEPTPTPQKKLIKNGSLTMQVEDYAKARPVITKLITQHKGYIGSENETNSGSEIRNHISIRVPFNEFDALVNNLEKEAKYIESKAVNVQDVTAQFVDIEGRLKTRREVEARYMEFLKKAKNIDETLKIEEQIRQLREEIESAEGQLKLMRDQVMYSTLELNVYQSLPYKVAPSAETGFFAKLGQAFKTGWRIMLDLIVGLAYLWPFIIAGLILLFILRRKYRKDILK